MLFGFESLMYIYTTIWYVFCSLEEDKTSKMCKDLLPNQPRRNIKERDIAFFFLSNSVLYFIFIFIEILIFNLH